MTKAKKKPKTPPKNVGGRPRKDPAHKARRIAVYLPGPQFHALLGRALFLETQAKRGPNESRGRTSGEEEEAIVAAYAKTTLLNLAERILGAPAVKS